MLAGAIPLGLCFFLQWFVPSITNQWLLFAYFSGIALLLDTAFTVVAVPYSTLAAELTTGYDERTNLVSFKAAFSIGASILSLGNSAADWFRASFSPSFWFGLRLLLSN
jgi:GPH family glycoside/pentoside/hexuronide:cation symporter